MIHDLLIGIRIFRRHLGLASAAVLSLALGVGANTAIFSVLENVVLSPLPYRTPERLAIVYETSAENSERWVAPANFVDWRRETRSFDTLAAFDEFGPTLSGYGEAQRLRALGVSGNYFELLGVHARVGRTLTSSDDGADAPPAAVLSDGLWSRLFGSSRDALGRTLTLDGRQFTVVGVMPPEFEPPLQPGIDVWLTGDRGVPRTFPFGGDVTTVRDSHIIYVLGRLSPGVSRDAAHAELTALMRQLAVRYPDTNAGLGVNIVPLHEAVAGDVRGLVLLLQLAVGMMLLIACANVAHLLLGQAAGRSGEMAMRAALGAPRRRLVRQLLAETLVIALPGGILGLVIAAWGLETLVALAPRGLPRLQEIGINPSVLAFTTAVTLLTGLLFGVGPAWQSARQSLVTHAAGRVVGGRSVRRWHHAIVVTELALAEVLLVGAGLLLASFVASQRVALGFATEGRVAADLNLAPERYLRPVREGAFEIDPARKLQFVDAVLERLHAAPGVRAAGASFTSPLTGAPNRGMSIAGRPARGPGQEDTADFQMITPGFFHAVGATLVRGRRFTDQDRSNTVPVAIVNEAFVSRYFPNEEPIGRRVQFGAAFAHEIVGVVGDMRYRDVERPADPTFYIPMTQNRERWPFLSFAVAGTGDDATLVRSMREAVRAADPNQAITRVRTFDEALSAALAPRRFNTSLVAVFAGVAMLLAVVGIYGVMAYAVSVRTREIGLRAALGATPRDLLRLVVTQGAGLTAASIAIGLAAALATTTLLRTMLFEVTPRDPQTFAVVTAALGITALVATWLPARRAIRVNPVNALRE